MSVLVPPRRASVERMTPPSVTLSAEPVAAKAGPVGPGAGPLLTEYAIASVLKRTPQQVMAQAAVLWREVAWIRAAERVISGTVAGSPIPGAEGKVNWHIEDPDGETIDDGYKGDPRAKEVFELLCHPQAKVEGQRLTRREMWNLTSRHMGICGPSFWFKDQMDAFGVPLAYMYIRPDRLTPIPDDDGNLKFWLLDADKRGKKPTRLEIDELVQFNLELPDEGFFGVGLVVSAINKIQFGQALDRHATSVVASGGRLSGIISPKQGVIDNDNIFGQIVRDWRNITEQPDAAKRAQVVRYPIEFTRTTADMQQLEVVKLLTNNRDELIELWGVPLSQIGGSSPAGLNSGDVRKYDRQALVENAVQPRTDVMTDAIGAEMACWKTYLGGWAPKFTFDLPRFEDDSPRYAMAAQSLGLPLRGSERRNQVGLDPLGPDVIGPSGLPVDEEIYILNTMVNQSGTPPVPVAPAGTVIAGSPMPAPDQKTVPDQKPQGKPPSNQPPPAKAKDLSQDDYIKIVTVDLAHQYPAEVLGWVKLVVWSFDPSVKIKNIAMTKEPGKLAPKVVTAIASGIEAGADIDPIILVDLPSKTQRLIANGNHRVDGAQQAGTKKLQAYVGTATRANEQEVLDGITEMQAPQFDDKGVPKGKADLRSSMRAFRVQMEKEITPRLRASAARVLSEQKQSVLGEVRLHHEHLMRKPADSSVWWKQDWNAKLLAALSGSYQALGTQVPAQINAHKADLGINFGPAVPISSKIIAAILTKAAKRVTEINDTTRDELVGIIEQGAREGLSPAQLGDRIEAYSGFDEYRAERIATTELRQAYNEAARGSYADAGIEMLTAIDGDGDEMCAARNGNNYTIDEAGVEDDTEHPNGTLDWLPVVTGGAALGDLEDQ